MVVGTKVGNGEGTVVGNCEGTRVGDVGTNVGSVVGG